MFKRLEQQNITNKTSSRSNNVSPVKKPTTYSQLLRKKQNNSELYDYQIANFCDHLYQGCFQNNKKHGEGITILNTGIILIGNWNKGKLNGYALFITPFGGKIHANYCLGFLQGWVILQYNNSFQILKYSQDKYQPLRKRYDESEQLWTEALYTSNGRLQKVLKIQKTANFNLPTFIVDKKLQDLYNHIIIKQQTNLNPNKITIIKINNKFQYYGYVNRSKIPNGLGIIFSHNQLYIGNFKSGSLDLQGLILFQNGLIYKGEIYAGKILGNGSIYDINLDQTKFIKVSQDGIQYVMQFIEGCKINTVPFKIGKSCSITSDKGFTSAIDHLCQSLTKYYFRFNSLNSVDHGISMSSDQSIKKNDEENQKQATLQNPQSLSLHHSDNQYNFKKYAEKQAERLQLLTTKNITQIQQSPITTTIKNRKINTNQNKCIHISNGKQNKNQSLQFQMQQVQPIPNSPINTIPLLTPTCDQIQNGDKKLLYPHLLQFQMSKNVFTACKFSKIGKIVNNTIKVAESLI